MASEFFATSTRSKKPSTTGTSQKNGKYALEAYSIAEHARTQCVDLDAGARRFS